MKTTIDFATEDDLPALANAKALAFYEALGFEKSAMVVRRKVLAR